MGRNGFWKALSIMFIKHSYYDKNKANILLRTSGADSKTPALWLDYQLQIIQELMTVRLQRPSKDFKRSQCRDREDGICHATVRVRVQGVFYIWDPPTESWSSTFFCLFACFSSFPTLHAWDQGSLLFPLFNCPPPMLRIGLRVSWMLGNHLGVSSRVFQSPLKESSYHSSYCFIDLVPISTSDNDWLTYLVSLSICHFVCLFQINGTLQYAILWLESFT